MRIACLQMRSTLSPDENLATLSRMVTQAAAQGATYIQTPEMTSLLDKNKQSLLTKIEPWKNNSFIAASSVIARNNNVWLHLGSIAIKAQDGKAFNRSILISPNGDIVGSYDKIHMFDVSLPNNETWRESSTYIPGTKAIVAETGQFCLGMSICYDLRFPHLYRSLAMSGANVLSCPSSFTKQTGRAHWHILLRARAIENGAFMVAAAQGGTHEDGRETFGHSLIVNPWGDIVAELDHANCDILICDIDLKEVETAREQIQSLSHGRTYEIDRIEYLDKK